MTTVRECESFSKNRVPLLKQVRPMMLLPAQRPLNTAAIEILAPLHKTKRGCFFILVITDRFTKLTKILALKRISAYDVATIFINEWVLKYGPPQMLVSDNGSQFVSEFFQSVCTILSVNNSLTTTYHPKTNGLAERFNSLITAILRCYIEDNPADWCSLAR